MFVDSYLARMMLLCLTGASWAVTTWVRFVLIGYDVRSLGVMGATEQRIGGIIGLHYMAISAPQIASALMMSFLFYVLPHFGVEDAIGWVLQAGAIANVIAAFTIIQLEI